jgi:hypothetical protein
LTKIVENFNNNKPIQLVRICNPAPLTISICNAAGFDGKIRKLISGKLHDVPGFVMNECKVSERIVNPYSSCIRIANPKERENEG